MISVVAVCIIACVFSYLLGAISLYYYLWKIKGKPRRGFTDRMYLFNVAFVTITVVTSFVAMFYSGYFGISDLSPISVIVPSAFGELAIHTGFVVDKARKENESKYRNVIQEDN